MIGAVVVLYNPTKEEVNNINTYKNRVSHTVIIDNSNVNNQKMVDEIVFLSSNITYYSEQLNMGLAKAFNIGIDILHEIGCNWALLFDADSRLESDIITAYKEAMNKYGSEVAVFSPIHIFDRAKKIQYKGYRKVNWAKTSGCLYNCEIFKKQNGFKEELFVDGLDMDYCYKVREKGYKIIEVEAAKINHFPAISKVVEIGNKVILKYGYASPWRYYMQARALIWLILRYKSYKDIVTYLYKWFKVLCLFDNKVEFMKQMVKGSRDGICLWCEYKSGK